MSQTNISHGKVGFKWCDGCGNILLGRHCSRCGSEGRMFEVNAPGDIRPAMEDGQKLVKGLFESNFGSFEPFEGRMVFFNKITGDDRSDEIVIHGQVVGALRYDIQRNLYDLDLRQAGSIFLRDHAKRNILHFKGMSGHLKGKTGSSENIVEVVGEFDQGDPLILIKGSKVGPGTALVSSNEMNVAERAFKIKGLESSDPLPMSPMSDRNVFAECNRDHLKGLESTGVSDIRSFIKGKSMPITVSFSGGKDSLAAFGLARKAVKDPILLFIDTGLEFPDTLEYVRMFSRDNGLDLRVADAGDAFWENVESFGPPAKDFRWCCKVCKLGPITELIARDFPKGVITIEGNRMLESYSRSTIGFVSKNPFVPNQTNLNPIRTWKSAEVWGYIWMSKLKYNPLYERDFERIGCYLCASCLSSEWRNVEFIHPDLYNDWEGHLRDVADRNGLSKEYHEVGLWRWRSLPPKMLKIAEGLSLKSKKDGSKDIIIKMVKGASKCTSGGFSAESVVFVPSGRDFSYVADSLRTIGDVRYSEDFDIVYLKTKNGTSKVFGGGQISVVAGSESDARTLMERSIKAYIRAEMCSECGICSKGCNRRAITIKGGLRVDPSRCNGCGRCERSCMVIHYCDKMVKNL